MGEQALSFLFLREPNIRLVVAGVLLLSLISALVGCFTFLRKRSLMGDAIAHSVLPGICVAFLLNNEKNPALLLLGALLSGLLSVALMEAISRRRLARPDTALSLLLSTFFGLGIVLLTYIQHQGFAAQAGLEKYLFGKAAGITSADVQLLGISAILIIASILLLRRGFTLLAFDEEYARAAGWPVPALQFCLSVLTVWAVSVGIQAVGVVLMAALLITPALAARFWTHSIARMLLLAACIGMLSGYTGAFVSFLSPGMPTGPWIVVAATLLAGISMLFAPRSGVLARWQTHRNNRNTMLRENILKLFYQLGEKSGNLQQSVLEEDLLNQRAFAPQALRRGLRTLELKGLLLHHLHAYQLSDEGLREARRVVRLHRLWELYLQRYLHLAPDHVHDDAEAMEHVITPEIEEQLEHLLQNPERDPHNTAIPPKA